VQCSKGPNWQLRLPESMGCGCICSDLPTLDAPWEPVVPTTLYCPFERGIRAGQNMTGCAVGVLLAACLLLQVLKLELLLVKHQLGLEKLLELMMGLTAVLVARALGRSQTILRVSNGMMLLGVVGLGAMRRVRRGCGVYWLGSGL